MRISLKPPALCAVPSPARSSRPSALSIEISTRAWLPRFRLGEPAKITSDIAPPRTFLAEWVPRTHASASTTLDLPEPLGPTMTVIPGSTYYNGWLEYPFSATEWNHRELGVQILNLAYRTGVSWNESGFSNAEFDELLTQANGIADADERRQVTVRLQEIMQEEAVAIIPFWRSLFRHYKPEVMNADMHPKFEINVHYLGIAA